MTGVDVYAPGADITAEALTAVVSGRFVKIAGNRAGSGLVSVAHADAAGRVAGVARIDAAPGALITVARGSSRVVRVATGAMIAAFAEIEVGADGKAVTKSSGVAVGYALTAAANGSTAEISLYH